MTDPEFDALLQRREDLRDQHTNLCEEINGQYYYRSQSLSFTEKRNRVWRELQSVEAQIAEELTHPEG